MRQFPGLSPVLSSQHSPIPAYPGASSPAYVVCRSLCELCPGVKEADVERQRSKASSKG